MGGGHLTNSDCTGGNIGVIVFGNSIRIDNSRFEVHNTAIACGIDETGVGQAMVGLSLDNIGFESNGTAVDFMVGTGAICTNLFVTGFQHSAPGRSNPQYGLRLRGDGPFRCQFDAMFANGDFQIACIAIEDASSKRFNTFSNVTASNSGVQGGVAWLLPKKAHTCSFRDCMNQDRPLVAIYTFANLPVGNSVGEGDEFLISDAPATANIGDTVTVGGGTLHCKVYWNGSSWTVVGK